MVSLATAAVEPRASARPSANLDVDSFTETVALSGGGGNEGGNAPSTVAGTLRHLDRAFQRFSDRMIGICILLEITYSSGGLSLSYGPPRRRGRSRLPPPDRSPARM